MTALLFLSIGILFPCWFIITLRLFPIGANPYIFIKCAVDEGMGSVIPIKYVRQPKSRSEF